MLLDKVSKKKSWTSSAARIPRIPRRLKDKNMVKDFLMIASARVQDVRAPEFYDTKPYLTYLVLVSRILVAPPPEF